MDKTTAQRIVRETFQAPFDRKRYRNFINEFCNNFNESKAQPMMVKDAFKPHVKSCQRLGTYTSPEGELADILIVNLTASYKLERTRTALRDFAADKLKRGDGEDNSYKEAGLVAFIAPDSQSWRFSFVRMEYETRRDPKTGKIKAEERLTPARRYSYLVGADEECHTAQTRFLALLQNTTDQPTLAQIEEAFSVESVTKEFFEKYKILFLELRDELDAIDAKNKTVRAEFAAKNVSTADFAKKLLGQIVFLYFIQKKGWLGVEKAKEWGTGPRDFLRRLFSACAGAGTNFFNDILEPLFYDTLATDRGGDAWCKIFKCRIPFLNGGLFEPLRDYDWRKTGILIPNELFSNSEPFDEGIDGTGVLDVFDRYNFTVNEAEPLEKEVAIDPEMLGKVFENLLGVQERKSKGSFYTPREIVHYMCQESLINYLDRAVNTADETIGAEKPTQGKLFGPPPAAQASLKTTCYRENVPRVEIETFIRMGEQISHYEAVETKYRIKMPGTIEKHARLIDEKLADIFVCDPAIGSGAFPVGMMQEIVRARLALAPYFKDAVDRTRYQFKRHAIQKCLYGVDIDPGAVEIAKLRLWLSLVVDEENVQQIEPLPNLDYKIVVGNSLLGLGAESKLYHHDQLRQIEELKPKFFDESDRKNKAEFKKQIDELIHEVTDGREIFDFEVYFSEVFYRNKGFDVVLGNPPYVRQESIKDLKPLLKAARYECFTGTADLLVYFYERSVKLLHSGGALALITSNKYYRASYGQALRRFLARELTLQLLIDFGDAPVFEAIAYASILTGVRTAPLTDTTALGYTWEMHLPFDRIGQIIWERSQKIRQEELKPDGWRLESPASLGLLEKLRRAGKPLGKFINGRIYLGIKTGLNEAFVICSALRDRLIREHKSSADIIKPIVRGRDVKRWRVEFTEQYLIKIESSENKSHPWSGKSEKQAAMIFAETFPAIYEHFQSLRDKKLDKPDARGCRNMLEQLQRRDDQGKYFWELRSCAYWHEFEKPKILYPDIYEHQSFTWDERGSYAANTCYIIPTTEKWLVALLNSQAVEWFYSNVSNKVRGGYMRAFSDYMCQIPVPATPPEKQRPLVSLVDRILAAKAQDANTDTSTWEREIDQLVCDLYGLTPAECALVERSVKRNISPTIVEAS